MRRIRLALSNINLIYQGGILFKGRIWQPGSNEVRAGPRFPTLLTLKLLDCKLYTAPEAIDRNWTIVHIGVLVVDLPSVIRAC